MCNSSFAKVEREKIRREREAERGRENPALLPYPRTGLAVDVEKEKRQENEKEQERNSRERERREGGWVERERRVGKRLSLEGMEFLVRPEGIAR